MNHLKSLFNGKYMLWLILAIPGIMVKKSI